jgi:DNA polymerase III gamma/tau subunit
LENRLRFVFDQIGKQYDDEAISAIARAGAGSVRDMLSIADTCASYTSGKLTYADVNMVLGNADFEQVATLCRAVLDGDVGKAFEGAEAFLSAGKSVGMLLKDVMNFLNACAVAKTCRDGQKILAFPNDMYALVAAVAKETDGHRLLRVMEIFSLVEPDLKYATSPRIVFETAVMKASMPEADYNIETLISRIAQLEKSIKEGVVLKNDGGMYASNTQMNVASQNTQAVTPASKNVAKEEKLAPRMAEEPAYEMADFDIPPEMDAPPDEETTGGNVYFDVGFEPKQTQAPIKKQAPAIPTPTSTTVAETTTARAVKPALKGDAKVTFGSFLRSIRKIAKSGVLLTLCMDLDSEYDDGVFVLYTSSDTIYRSLNKPDHAEYIAKAFSEIGIDGNGYELRLKGKQSDTFDKGVAQIKDTFQGVKVELK